MASHPTIKLISCTSAFVSLEFAELDLSCESFAWRQGCVETWTFGGRLEVDMVLVFDSLEEVKSRSNVDYRAWVSCMKKQIERNEDAERET